jgi:hypothetical protein
MPTFRYKDSPRWVRNFAEVMLSREKGRRFGQDGNKNRWQCAAAVLFEPPAEIRVNASRSFFLTVNYALEKIAFPCTLYAFVLAAEVMILFLASYS